MSRRGGQAVPGVGGGWTFDPALAGAALILLGLGLVMVASASIAIAERELGDPMYFVERQAVHAVLALIVAAAVVRVPLRAWERAGPWLLGLAVVALIAVLIPGLGKEVNGSQRWLALGPFTLQASEPARLAVIVFMAGYLVRQETTLREQPGGVLRPAALTGLVCALLLAEPDYGAAAVLAATVLAMLYLGGARLGWFVALVGAAVGLMGALAVASPYRVERLTTFLNPWADPFDRGFQLTQSLIAIGRGEWIGVGLGASVQKLFYLPEAHTDFLFAVLAEELGLLGVTVVVGLYSFVIWRAFAIGAHAEERGARFGAHLAYGVALWIGMQAFINIGVTMGVLPTKGLTLPLMSYGGSSLLVTAAALAMVLRVERETRPDRTAPRRRRSGRGRAAA